MIDTSRCDEYFAQVYKWAKEIGKREKFERWLDYLRTFGNSEENPERHKCVLTKDFAPQSFLISFQRVEPDGSYREYMNGGLIYHDASGDWSVHT